HWHNGFLGTGHRAMAVLEGVPYKDSDPFILFMDDSLNLPGGEPVGGAHPHAGFETLSLVLEGNEKDWKTGSFELMTAGKALSTPKKSLPNKNFVCCKCGWYYRPKSDMHSLSYKKYYWKKCQKLKTIN